MYDRGSVLTRYRMLARLCCTGQCPKVESHGTWPGPCRKHWGWGGVGRRIEGRFKGCGEGTRGEGRRDGRVNGGRMVRKDKERKGKSRGVRCHLVCQCVCCSVCLCQYLSVPPEGTDGIPDIVACIHWSHRHGRPLFGPHLR
jgi:hypothetical protein